MTRETSAITISVSLSIGSLHKRQTAIKPRKLLNHACGSLALR